MLESIENNAWNTEEIQKLLMVPEAIEDSRLMGRRQRPFFSFGKGEVRNANLVLLQSQFVFLSHIKYRLYLIIV